jgi:hypothetical protein
MWQTQIVDSLAREHIRDLRAAVRAARGAHRSAAPARIATLDGEVRIRLATPADAVALRELAELDSRPVPTGDVLVAEVGGGVRAALPLDGGPAVADPFSPSRPLVAMLALRAGLA